MKAFKICMNIRFSVGFVVLAWKTFKICMNTRSFCQICSFAWKRSRFVWTHVPFVRFVVFVNDLVFFLKKQYLRYVHKICDLFDMSHIWCHPCFRIHFFWESIHILLKKYFRLLLTFRLLHASCISRIFSYHMNIYVRVESIDEILGTKICFYRDSHSYILKSCINLS